MTDTPPQPERAASPAAEAPPAEASAERAYPWEADPPPEEEFTPDGRRVRHDAFTARRRHDFLRSLARTGCLSDACRALGVAPGTVYRHQQEDAGFAANCRAAIEMAAVPVEIAAWQRAVEGVDQQFACGGEVHVRRRYSDGLLRILLQGSNPKKYGPNPGFTRKRMLRHERKAMAREIRAELEAEAARANDVPNMPIEAVREEILRRVNRIREHRHAARLGEGWTRTPEGHWIPPGYGPLAAPQPVGLADGNAPAPGGAEAGAPASRDGETPRDSV